MHSPVVKELHSLTPSHPQTSLPFSSPKWAIHSNSFIHVAALRIYPPTLASFQLLLRFSVFEGVPDQLT